MIKDKESPCCPLGLIPSSRSSQQEPVEMLLGQRTTNCKIEKECNVPELASRNSYEKWVISTFTSLPANAYWKLSSFLPPLKVVDQKNYFGSRAFSSKDMQSPSSPLEANFQVKKSTEDTDCVKLAPFNSSSRANISCQSQNRSKLAKKVNHSSNTSSSGLVSGTSSDSVNSLNADCSNFLLHDIHIMEEAVKEYGRTHSKKRGKQYKRTIQQRVSGKKFFGNLDKAVPSSLSVKNLTVDDLNNNGQMDLKSCAPPIGDTDVSGLIVSPQKFPSAKFSCNNISCQNVASTSTQAADPSTFGVYTKNVHGVANISLHDNSLTASRHENVSEDASVVDSSLDSWSCNFTENFGDDIEVHASAILMKEGRASSSGVLRLGSRELDTPFNRISVDSCAMNIEMSNALGLFLGFFFFLEQPSLLLVPHLFLDPFLLLPYLFVLTSDQVALIATTCQPPKALFLAILTLLKNPILFRKLVTCKIFGPLIDLMGKIISNGLSLSVHTLRAKGGSVISLEPNQQRVILHLQRGMRRIL